MIDTTMAVEQIEAIQKNLELVREVRIRRGTLIEQVAKMADVPTGRIEQTEVSAIGRGWTYETKEQVFRVTKPIGKVKEKANGQFSALAQSISVTIDQSGKIWFSYSRKVAPVMYDPNQGKTQKEAFAEYLASIPKDEAEIWYFNEE